MDRVLNVFRGFDPTLKPNCNWLHIGQEMDGQLFNSVPFGPKKNSLSMELKLP